MKHPFLTPALAAVLTFSLGTSGMADGANGASSAGDDAVRNAGASPSTTDAAAGTIGDGSAAHPQGSTRDAGDAVKRDGSGKVPEGRPAPITGRLTLQAAVETALTYNVDSKIADRQSRAARAEALTARAPMLPQVDFNASYGFNFDIPYGRENDLYQSFNASLSASQLIYDFGKSRSRWKAAKAKAIATENTQLATRQTVILDVRNAFFDVLEAHALVMVGEKILENDLKHLEQTQELVDAGTKPTIDLVKLKSEVASAKASLVQAQGNERVARAQLSFLVGRPIPPDVEVAEPELGSLGLEGMSVMKLFEQALESRPEFASQKAAIQAQSLTLESTESNLYPALYAVAGVGWNWRHIDESNGGVDVGLRLTWTIFDGFSNKGAKIVARENLAMEQLRLTYQEQKVFKAVEEAKLNVDASSATLVALDEALQAANELLASAEERYAAGVGNVIELTDAQFDVAEAESKRVRGHYDVLTARAALLNAVGAEGWE